MDIIILSLAGVFAGMLVIMSRFLCILEFRARALCVIYKRADWMEMAMVFDTGPDHHEMMLDWRKWTFKQFYPWLAGTR